MKNVKNVKNWYKISQQSQGSQGSQGSQKKVLFIMRGTSGAGKSTVAKKIPGIKQENIFSTDQLIATNLDDYNAFFQKMTENEDFTPLVEKMKQNLSNAVHAMQRGESPIAIDNTNIEAWQAKSYVEAGLKFGYSIEFLDVGTGGLTVEELHKRNVHNVPLETIREMVNKYQKEGPLTVEKVLNSESPFEDKKSDPV